MILALGFFVNGTLSSVDYREFVRTNALSHEHLMSAKHFLQREFFFDDDIELKLMKWYSEFPVVVMNTIEDRNSFDARHNNVYEPAIVYSRETGINYVKFMEETILPRIREFQDAIRVEIR